MLTCHVIAAKALAADVAKMAKADGGAHKVKTVGGCELTLKAEKGKVTVTDGPFTETNEVLGGYAQFELKSRDDAIKSAVRFMELHKKHWPGWEGETEVRQMFGPDDFGPENCAPQAEERSPATVR